ncbi:calcium/sodium antiporter [Crassaminicella thermophila]|uniref:Calcium/sodium antiporter n=1 Tax=Crassaminicella thermophila TaxID=2599308 RepID=A0A5C0SDL6_CRATE|nr:calcium/sodium antiporter [Crassaminicella thermophila]QEK12042.1 calcium/sodium antiporter [Crassaminicella thermophila]
MENLFVYVMFFVGLIIIIKGGNWFVDAAVWIAITTGVPNILVGATIVSLATTLPEFFVSTIAVVEGYSEMAIGNAIGSTICNIGLVLGLCAFISPIQVRRKFFSIKGFMMIFSLLCFYYFANDKVLTKIEGFMLILFLIIYIIINVFEFNNADTSNSFKKHHNIGCYNIFINIAKFVVGAFAVIIGAKLLVDNGVRIANILHIPKQVVSLTLIALGTSLPELVTSITATIKGHQGISVGNIIGANVLNITMVLGASSIISNKGLMISIRNIEIFNKTLVNVPQTLILDIPMSFLLMCILVLCGTFRRKVDRKHGLLIFVLYIAYIAILGLISF